MRRVFHPIARALIVLCVMIIMVFAFLCALMLSRAGLKPVVYERGECVEKRSLSVEKMKTTGRLNVNSNVQLASISFSTVSLSNSFVKSPLLFLELINAS